MRKKILIGIGASMLLLITACSSVQSSDVKYSRFNYEPVKILNTDGHALDDGFYTVITDTKTGVQYLKWCGHGAGGITPLYNADGTLCTAGE